MSLLEPGMTKAQVYDLMGSPTSTSRVANRLFLNYDIYMRMAGHMQMVPHFIVLEKGVVTEWGTQAQVQSPVSTTVNQSVHVQDAEVN